MPLIWELTAEFRRWLPSDKLLQFNQNWQSQGGGWQKSVIDKFVQLLENKELHYEQIVGALEVEYLRESDPSVKQNFHNALGFVLQTIYGLLLERQVKNTNYSIDVLNDFSNLEMLVRNNKPLWIFSLNHDLIIEMLAAKLEIPLKSGFNDKTTIRMSGNGIDWQEVNFERLLRSDIANHNYDFFKEGETGINLVKMHGSLDIFAQGDDINYLKLSPAKLDPSEYTTTLSRINEINHEFISSTKIVCTNESVYLDENKTLQFLRKTLLSGAHKFSKKLAQLAPPEFLQLFENKINSFNELICIGYSFGDKHTDHIIIEWLTSERERLLSIINPTIENSPTHFVHLHAQVNCQTVGAADYFLDLDRSKDSTTRRIMRQIRNSRRIDVMKSI